MNFYFNTLLEFFLSKKYFFSGFAVIIFNLLKKLY